MKIADFAQNRPAHGTALAKKRPAAKGVL